MLPTLNFFSELLNPPEENCIAIRQCRMFGFVVSHMAYVRKQSVAGGVKRLVLENTRTLLWGLTAVM